MRRIFTLLFFLIAFTSQAQIPRNGLLAWYPLNGNTNDSSGNGFNGTAVNAHPAGGECGDGYLCDNTATNNNLNSYIDCGNPAGQQFDLQNDASLCFWFELISYPTGTAGCAVLGKDVSGGSVPKWFVSVFNDSVAFHINDYTFGNGHWIYSNSYHFNLNTFYHVVITKTGSTNTYQFFINSMLWGTQTMPVSIPVIPHDMQIGQNEGVYTDEVMDEVMVYDVVLTQLQIDTVYNACNIHPIKASFAASDSVICAGSCITFTNSSIGATSYQWSFPGADNPTSNSANPGNVCYSTPGQYDVQLIVDNGSTNDTLLKKLYIMVNPACTAGAISAATTILCAGKGTQLSDSGSAGTLKWQSSTDGTNFTDIGGATDSTYTTPPLNQTIYYRLIAQNGTCNPDTSAAQMISVNPTPVAGTVQALRDSLCQGTAGKLTLVNSSGTPIQWQSSTNNINFTNINAVNGTSYTTQPLLQSLYIRVVVGTGACADTSLPLQLYVPPPLFANFFATVSGKTITFNSDSSSGNIKSYNWNFDDNSLTSNEANPTHTFSSDSTYNVCLTLYDGTNCSYTFCRYVSIADGISPVTINNQWLVYPNPFGNYILISGNEPNIPIKSYEIYDVLGRKMLDNYLDNSFQNPLMIDASLLSTGMYFLKIRTSQGDYLQKVVKQ